MSRSSETHTHIAPSLLAADFLHLEDEIRRCEAAGLTVLHLDVMDGHFVPNLTFGPPVIRQIRSITKLELDVHLMIEKPELSIADYARAGADAITVHAEVSPHLHRTLANIKELGCRAGVALNPSTPTAHVEHVLPLCDIVLVMSVNPGFGGQKFIPVALEKLASLRVLQQSGRGDFMLSVDGGVDPVTSPSVVEAGAERLVTGSALFGKDFDKNLLDLQRAAGC
ncbi:MAG: ribulose-phosphate 3-epimerase [Calditrichaeota bacterium]|nr:ribulose-phosphate 3-epimerase [Calditrichota bacterium]MCB9368037.1 ribulose-phosphate 3-epimerase [Calditrichota bacterium]